MAGRCWICSRSLQPAARDEWISWDVEQRQARLHGIVGMCRYKRPRDTGLGHAEVWERRWKSLSQSMQQGHTGYIAAGVGMTKDCDCLGIAQQPLLPDIDFFASANPVALDQAVYDAAIERTGRNIESMSYPRLDGTPALFFE